jgi:hypothetical protein
VNLKPKDGFPTLIAALVFVVVLFICIRLHVHAYVGTLMLLAVGGAYALAGRIARGSPELRREEWTLHAADLGNGQVADVLRGLEQHGYDISIIGVSEAGVPARATHPAQPLAGARLGIRDRRHPIPAAGLTLLLPAPAPVGQRTGFGMVTVTDTDPNEGTYAEMAQYLIATLGELQFDLRFKRLSSGLPPDPAYELRAKLPRSPRHLPGSGVPRSVHQAPGKSISRPRR